MTDAVRCSFCRKTKGSVLDLVLSRRDKAACICDECLETCNKILRKSGTEPIVDRPTAYRISSAPAAGLLRCSFCSTSQEAVHRLIASSPGQAITHICDRCVELCGRTIASGDAAGVKNTAPISDWVARKAGVHKTTVHHIG